MNKYTWHLSMHGGDTVEAGTVRAESLEQATELAMVDAFGSLEYVALPDEHRPGYIHWAGELEGSTTLTVELDTPDVTRFWVQATLPAPIVVDADGEPLDEFLWKPYVPIQGGPGEWWFGGEYVRGQTPKPVVMGIVDATNEDHILEQVEQMFGPGVVVKSAVPRHDQWEPQSTISGINAYPKEGERVAARIRKVSDSATSVGAASTKTSSSMARSSGRRSLKSEVADLERALGLGRRKRNEDSTR